MIAIDSSAQHADCCMQRMAIRIMPHICESLTDQRISLLLLLRFLPSALLDSIRWRRQAAPLPDERRQSHSNISEHRHVCRIVQRSEAFGPGRLHLRLAHTGGRSRCASARSLLRRISGRAERGRGHDDVPGRVEVHGPLARGQATRARHVSVRQRRRLLGRVEPRPEARRGHLPTCRRHGIGRSRTIRCRQAARGTLGLQRQEGRGIQSATRRERQSHAILRSSTESTLKQ